MMKYWVEMNVVTTDGVLFLSTPRAKFGGDIVDWDDVVTLADTMYEKFADAVNEGKFIDSKRLGVENISANKAAKRILINNNHIITFEVVPHQHDFDN